MSSKSVFSFIDARRIWSVEERGASQVTPPVPYQGTYVSQGLDQPTPGHAAIDIAVCDGVSRIDVVSVADGEVFQVCDGAGDQDEQTVCGINGNYVRVKYDIGNGPFIMQYGHLTAGSLTVGKGEKVSSGQKLGTMGKSGSATGIHTHFHIFNLNLQNTSEDFRLVFGVNEYPTGCGRHRGHGRRHVEWAHD